MSDATRLTDDLLEVEQGFAMVPDWLLRAKLQDKAKTLYAVLQRFGNGSGARMPSQSELAQWLHCDIKTVHRVTTALEDFGALRVERSPAISRGQTGVTRAPNRYFLRTTDPSVTHVIRRSRGTDKNVATPTDKNVGDLPSKMSHDRGRDLPPPAPSRLERRRRETLQSVAAELDETTLAAFGGLDGLNELAARCIVIRREAGLGQSLWMPVHVARAVVVSVDRGDDPSRIPAALAALAADRETRSPMRLPHDGPWWDLADLEDRREQRRRRAVEQAADEERRRAEQEQRQAGCTRCAGTGSYTRTLTVLGETRVATITCDHAEESTA